MIRIFNQKLSVEIQIDEKLDWVQLTTRDYESKPFILIELSGANFLQHAQKCPECSQFLNAFGTRTVHWYVEYLGKVQRIDTEYLGTEFGDSQIQFLKSEYFNGTKITIGFNPLPVEKAALREILLEKVLAEDYEEACIIRDLIEEK